MERWMSSSVAPNGLAQKIFVTASALYESKLKRRTTKTVFTGYTPARGRKRNTQKLRMIQKSSVNVPSYSPFQSPPPTKVGNATAMSASNTETTIRRVFCRRESAREPALLPKRNG